jgi:hypothetical protein
MAVPPPEQDSSGTTDEHCENDTKPLWPDFSSPQEKPTSAKSQEPDKKWWHTNDLPMLIVTFFGVVAVVVYTCVTHQQLNVMQRTLDDSEIQEAASITITNLTAAGFPDNIVISYDIENHGRTRADQVMVVLASGSMRPEEEFKIFTGEFGVGFISPNVNGLSIDPSDPPRHISVSFGSLPLIPQGIPPEISAKLPRKEDFVSGRFEVYFAVLGAYLDVFRKVHHVTDCIIFHSGNGFEPCTANHGRHN